jgi:hypothetical protein
MRYAIEFDTPVSDTVLSAFPGFVDETTSDGRTVISGEVIDESDLHSVIGRTRTLGLRFRRLQRLSPPTPPGAPGAPDHR